MNCPKCGVSVTDKDVFCPSCGEKLKEEQSATSGNKVNEIVDKVKDVYNKNPKYCKIGAAVAVVVVLLLCLLARPKTINLNKYITIEASGYDSVGTATATFDYDKFEKDYHGKIKLTKEAKKDAKELGELFGVKNASMSGDEALALMKWGISGKLDKDSGLSNGDTIVYEWKVDDADLKSLVKNKVKYKDVKYKVKGLEKVETKRTLPRFAGNFIKG